MIKFILNDKLITTDKPTGMTFLDFVRYHKHLTGTKIGCREGDCGACTVLVGEEINGEIFYKSMTSCITPLGNATGKHVVTIEGLNMDDLSPVQQAMLDAGATQCGFCTVGFVVSLSGYCLATNRPTVEGAIGAVDGNICRCTGYKSIERAIATIVESIKNKPNTHKIDWLISNKFLPTYFSEINKILDKINTKVSVTEPNNIVVAGGTDLYVQQPEYLEEIAVNLVYDRHELNGITSVNGVCTVGAATTVTDMMESELIKEQIPALFVYLKLVSSTPIRNMGTLAGNFVNASPIGDLTIFFLALNASIILKNEKNETRNIALKSFYLGYKELDKKEGEYIEKIEFKLLDKSTSFNFEKVSKRTHLDIATVNTALQIKMTGNTIEHINASAGGVGPVPTYLNATCEFLTKKELSIDNVKSAVKIMYSEISPISDVRGTAAYKKLLLRQLFIAHFITLFPEKFELKSLA